MASGWTPGSDGVLTNGDRTLTFSLLYPSEGERQNLARAVAAAWNALGARVTVVPSDTTALLDNALTPRAYQAALVLWDAGPDPDPYAAWHSDLRGSADGNFGDVADSRLDAAIAAGRRATTVAGRRDAYAAFAARFRSVAPGLVLFAEGTPFTLGPHVAGAEAGASVAPVGPLSTIHRWFHHDVG